MLQSKCPLGGAYTFVECRNPARFIAIIRSATFENMHVRWTPRYFNGFDGDPLLNIGWIQWSRQQSGQVPSPIIRRTKRVVTSSSVSAQCFSMRPGKPSGPVALSASMLRSIRFDQHRRIMLKHACSLPLAYMCGSATASGSLHFSEKDFARRFAFPLSSSTQFPA